MIYPETLLELSISWGKAIFFSPEEESSRRRDVARAFGVAADERCTEYKLIREFTNGNALYAHCWTSRVSAIDGTVEVKDSVRDEAADDCRLHQ